MRHIKRGDRIAIVISAILIAIFIIMVDLNSTEQTLSSFTFGRTLNTLELD